MPGASNFEIFDDGVAYKIVAGRSDDEIAVRQLGDGRAIVTVNGEELVLTPDQASRLQIDAGAGRDTITIHTAVDVVNPAGITVDGGPGDDHIVGGRGDDTLSGGQGRDYIDGGVGHDISDGGGGKDTIYGGPGDDEVSGGTGDDYLDGGSGDDTLMGGPGNDFLSGGDGRDHIEGGSGEDIAAGGAESNNFVSVEDQHGEFNPSSGSSIRIEGDPTFVSRVEADLATLRSLPAGRALLDSLDASGHETVILASTTGKNSAVIPKGEEARLQPDGTPGGGRDAKVKYNPMSNRRPGSESYKLRPPIVALYHELLHAEDVVHGTLRGGWSIQLDSNGDPVLDKSGLPRVVRNRELEAVGLPLDEANTADDKSGATMDPEELEPNTREITENRLREELGEPERWRY